MLVEAYKSSNKERPVKHKGHTEWFNEQLKEKRQKVRKLYNLLKPGTINDRQERLKQEYEEARQEYHKACKTAKTKSWRMKMETLESTKDISRFQKLMENKKLPELSTIKKNDGTYTNTEKETVHELMTTHFPECELLTQANQNVQANNPIVILTDEEKETIMEITKMDKIKWALDGFGPFKTAGEDGIFPALLQKTKTHTYEIVQELYRASLKLGYIPKSWRGTRVAFIPKPGKGTYDMAKSYRPISLMSFVLKGLEKILDSYIKAENLSQIPIDSAQHAYQRGKGTESALHCLSNKIEKSMTNEGIAIAVFMDIEGAFDNTGFDIIEEALDSKGVKKWATQWIGQMLRTRRIKATLGEEGEEYSPKRGSPQGGCLSPTLWCIVMDPLLGELDKEGVTVSAYADDLVVVCGGKRSLQASMCGKLSKSMKITENWCRRTGLRVNPDKTFVMKFSKGNRDKPLKPIKIFDKPITRVTEFKYLGVVFDERLNWSKHIDYIVKKSRKAMYAAGKMVARSWGLTPKAMLWIYKMIVMPRITYGCIIWWPAVKKKGVKLKLRTEQRNELMLVTGAVKSTPGQALDALLDMIPLERKIEELAMRACYRLMQTGLWRDTSRGGEPNGHRMIEARVKELRTENEDSDWIDRK